MIAPLPTTDVTVLELTPTSDLTSPHSSITEESPVSKKKRRSPKDKNIQRIEIKELAIERKIRHKEALNEGLELMAYADDVKKKMRHNSKYIKQEKKRNKDFKMPIKVRGILEYINKKYGVESDKTPLSRTSLTRYHQIGVDKRKSVGAPPSIPMALLNAVRLHILVLQASKLGQVSEKMIKAKLVASASGTEHEGFDPDWAWRRMRELWPTEIAPTSVSAQDSIRNEWTTYTKVNDWYTCNKKTLIDSGLAIDVPELLPDGTYAELTIGEIEKRRIVNFDETDHPLATHADKGGSRSIRWGHPDLAKGIVVFLFIFLF